MKRVFKTRIFAKWIRKTELSDHALCNAVSEMRQGLIDAELGGGVVKKRVALPGRGKRGSARTLVATNKSDLWFFVFGFEKKERANITTKELDGLQCIATDLLKLSTDKLASLVAVGALQEICHEHQDKSR